MRHFIISALFISAIAIGYTGSGARTRFASGVDGAPIAPSSVTPSGSGTAFDCANTPNGQYCLKFSGTNQGIHLSGSDTTANFQMGGAVVFNIKAGQLNMAGSAKLAQTNNSGTITLSAGSGTATVTSGARCICTDQTANASVKCAVSSTTLTATGTGTDVITYLCDQ